MEQVREIRERADASDSQLAREFGLTRPTVRYVRLGITYREPGMKVRASPWVRRSRRYGPDGDGQG